MPTNNATNVTTTTTTTMATMRRHVADFTGSSVDIIEIDYYVTRTTCENSRNYPTTAGGYKTRSLLDGI